MRLVALLALLSAAPAARAEVIFAVATGHQHCNPALGRRFAAELHVNMPGDGDGSDGLIHLDDLVVPSASYVRQGDAFAIGGITYQAGRWVLVSVHGRRSEGGRVSGTFHAQISESACFASGKIRGRADAKGLDR